MTAACGSISTAALGWNSIDAALHPTPGCSPSGSWNDALGLTDLAGAALSEYQRGKNTRHLLTGLLRQAVFGRLEVYEDINDADRLAHDPAMRTVVDRTVVDRQAASMGQTGRRGRSSWMSAGELRPNVA